MNKSMEIYVVVRTWKGMVEFVQVFTSGSDAESEQRRQLEHPAYVAGRDDVYLIPRLLR